MVYYKTTWTKGDVITAPKLNNIEDGIANAVSTDVAAELIRDTMGTALVAGNGIAVNVDDTANTITLVNTGATGGGAGSVSFVDNNDGTFTFTSPSITDNANGTFSFVY